MINEMLRYLVVTACFLLLFFFMAALVEPYKERLVRLIRKISWKTAGTFFYIWMGILVLRKLVYYIPFTGFIQTPDSVWWVDKKVLISLYALFLAFLLYVGAMELITRTRNSAVWSKWGGFIWNGTILCLIISVFVFIFIGPSFSEFPIIQIIFSPLLVLKIFCSGKYLGLIISLALAYFFAFGYKKIGPGLNRRYGKFLLVTVLILIGSGIFNLYKLPGDWEKRFLEKAQTAKHERAIEDLLDAAKIIKDHKQRVETLNRIASTLAETGNIQWAEAVVQSISDEKIKDKALQEIREKKEKKGKND